MKVIKHITLLSTVAMLLSGCFIHEDTSSTPSIEPPQSDTGDGYTKVDNFTYVNSEVTKTQGIYNLNTTGDAHILVIPVQISGEQEWTKTMLKNAELAFFGKAEETGWQSVKSFYELSSYGNITIKGEVAPVLKSKYTKSQLSNNIVNGSPMPDALIVEEFEKSSAYESLRSRYDKDSNGYIDSVVFMYSNAINSDKGYWAWVYWGGSNPSFSNPTVNTYMWVSYNFIAGDQKNKNVPYAAYGDLVDGHTVIHESGHMLGLDDYYCYDDNGWDPSGVIDMHSNNVGDDNIYSKMAMDWAKPYYVKTSSSVTLTLRTSAFYGDAILINDNWNGSPCDEYLAIEYYSPYGTNQKDAEAKYPGNGLRMYTVSGFRIYHIDARVVKLNERGGMIDYVDNISNNGYYAIGASNSKSYSFLKEHKGDFKLCHLMEAGGKNTFKSGKYATNETLFREGSSFEASSEFFYYGTKFNNGNEVGYKIEVGKCDTYEGTITITKI